MNEILQFCLIKRNYVYSAKYLHYVPASYLSTACATNIAKIQFMIISPKFLVSHLAAEAKKSPTTPVLNFAIRRERESE